MTGKTHTAIGMAIGLTLAFKKPIDTQLAIITASTIGALAPDLDHPKGELNQRLLLINSNFFKTAFYLIVGVVFLYVYVKTQSSLFMFLGLFSFALSISNHRTFTHSIIGLVLFATIIKLMLMESGSSLTYMGFIIGYTSHLLADSFNTKGIKLFFPFRANISFPLKVKTNGFAEKLIFFLFIWYCIVALILNFS